MTQELMTSSTQKADTPSTTAANQSATSTNQVQTAEQNLANTNSSVQGSSNAETQSSKNSTPSTPSSTETKSGDAKAELILGKYKTQDDLIRAYQNLEVKLGKGKTEDEIVGDDFDLIAEYKELGHEVKDTEEVRAELEPFRKQIAEQGFTKSQAKFYLQSLNDKAKTISEATLEKAGLNVNKDTEIQILGNAWGNESQTRYNQVKEWANKFLPRDVAAPLLRSAAGAFHIWDLMQARQGVLPVMAQANQATATHADSLQIQLRKLVADPDYKSNPEKQQQAAQIAARMAK